MRSPYSYKKAPTTVLICEATVNSFSPNKIHLYTNFNMSETIRTVKTNRFSIIDNQMLENATLSLQAKGLQAYLLSRPDGWTVSPTHLATTCSGGVSQIKATLRELEIARYIHREQLRDNKGRMAGWINWIYEDPALNPHPLRVLSVSGKPAYGKPVVGKSAPINTELNNTEINKKNSLERTRKKKLGEAESLISKTPEPVAQALEQAQVSSVLPVDPDLVDGKKGSAARSISTDKTKTIFGKTRPSVAQKQRAEEANWLSSGIVNKRWKDRQDFDKFVGYVEIYTENRRQDPELNPDGTKYGKEYQTAILNHTATTQDENDSMLVCWKTWNLEPVAPNYIEPKPEEVVVVDAAAEAAFKTNFANLKAANAARKAAAKADKLKKIEIVRGLYES